MKFPLMRRRRAEVQIRILRIAKDEAESAATMYRDQNTVLQRQVEILKLQLAAAEDREEREAREVAETVPRELFNLVREEFFRLRTQNDALIADLTRLARAGRGLREAPRDPLEVPAEVERLICANWEADSHRESLRGQVRRLLARRVSVEEILQKIHDVVPALSPPPGEVDEEEDG